MIVEADWSSRINQGNLIQIATTRTSAIGVLLRAYRAAPLTQLNKPLVLPMYAAYTSSARVIYSHTHTHTQSHSHNGE